MLFDIFLYCFFFYIYYIFCTPKMSNFVYIPHEILLISDILFYVHKTSYTIAYRKLKCSDNK